MRFFSSLLIFLVFQSCIPLKIAPKIETDKIYYGKKFKRNLSKSHYLIFEDPKDANDFYDFINAKYHLSHKNVGYNVPVVIESETYFMSYQEVERTTKTLNLIPIALDAALTDDCDDPFLEDLHTSREGYWYIALEVRDSSMHDALEPNYPKRKEVASYLRQLRKEYITTSNYTELLLKKKRP